MNRRQILAALIATIALPGMPSIGHAAEPSGPLKIIVGTPAGGASDTAARLLAQSMSRALGVKVQ